jgi:Arc/MetJ-type ribon-helix-helix transcriptional regulator
MAQIAVRLSDEELAELDRMVASGSYPSRAAVVRAGLAAMTERERRAEIAEAYREAYERVPQDEWFAESAATIAGQRLAAEESGH